MQVQHQKPCTMHLESGFPPNKGLTDY